MDKRLILAVAGSGKTGHLIDNLDLERRFLIVTHTNNNFRNLRFRIAKKFGHMPPNIKIYTYFSFLYGYCFRPFLSKKTAVRGINFDGRPYVKAQGYHRFIDSNRRVYARRLAKLIDHEGASNDVVSRISKYTDVVMIDEVQDFAANDFNFLPTIVRARTDTLFVGDFFQHTFDTSRDGPVKKNLHKDYEKYVKEFKSMGLTPDDKTLSHSYRCSPTVCEYVSTNLGINIKSHRRDETRISFLDSEEDIRKIYNDDNVVKLFYQSSKNYACRSSNWGVSKGEDHYTDVCIVLNGESYKKFQEGKLAELAPSSKNKLYVAITRTRGDLSFIAESRLNELVG